MHRTKEKVRVRGEYRAYVEFKAGANRFRNRKEKDRRQQYYNQLAALILFAFGIEAFLNHVGAKIDPKWWESVERSSFRAKLELLCCRLDINVKFNERPWKTIIECMKRRNDLGHSKYQGFDKIIEVDPRDLSKHMFPETKRDSIADSKFLQEISKDLEKFIDVVIKVANLENENPNSLGSAFGEPT